MKRSFLFSALVLVLAASMPACGGSAKPGETPEGGTPEGEGSGDAIADLKKAVDTIQADIDTLFQPIKDADATIDSVAALPKDLKAAGEKKVQPKALFAEVQKIVDGGDANIDSLGLGDAGKKILQERLDKLKALVAAIKALPDKVASIPAKFEDLPKKLAAAVPQAAKSLAKSKMPFGVSDADKKKAQEDVATVEGFKTQIPQKIEGWKKDLIDVPNKAKDLPAKMAKSFK